MEQNTSMIAKKIWNMMRVAFFLLRKGICKRKILMDLNLVIKRGKIASKALQKFMLNNPSPNLELSTVGKSNQPGEYEFSCSNTPLYRHYFTNNRRKNHNKNLCMPSSFEGMNNIEDVNNMFDMIMNSTTSNNNCDFLASPVLLGLGLGVNPDVRQLRIVDSPFLVENTKGNKHVDEAAEDFINMFYCQLKNQRN